MRDIVITRCFGGGLWLYFKNRMMGINERVCNVRFIFSPAIPMWRWWVGFEATLALLIALLVSRLPESVRWLLVVYRNDPDLNEDCEIRARTIVKVSRMNACNDKRQIVQNVS